MSNVCFELGIKIWWVDPEHVTKEDTRCHKYVCSVLACFPSGRIITLRASASQGEQKSSVSHCPIHNVRQHSENASETSISRALTASNHGIRHFSSWAQTCSSVDLRIRHVGCPELLRRVFFTHLLLPMILRSNSYTRILSTWQKKTTIAINRFALSWHAFSLRALLLFDLSS